jgi:hypothetical protein
VPETANADSFVLTGLGDAFVAHGPHTLRVRFLDGLVDLDWLFVKKMDPAFGLKVSTGKYLSANQGGGSTVNTAAPHAQIWEAFVFDDLNGGTLQDGDQVNLQSYNGHYLSSSAGSLTADKRAPGATEVFTVKLVSGTSIAVNSAIALLASDGKHYLTSNTGNSDASGTSIGVAQTFTLVDDNP